jgi:hypothetical protein
LVVEQDKLLKLLLELLTVVQVVVRLGVAIHLELEHKAILVEQQDTEMLAVRGFLETLAAVEEEREPLVLTETIQQAMAEQVALMTFQVHLYFMQAEVAEVVILEHPLQQVVQALEQMAQLVVHQQHHLL